MKPMAVPAAQTGNEAADRIMEALKHNTDMMTGQQLSAPVLTEIPAGSTLETHRLAINAIILRLQGDGK